MASLYRHLQAAQAEHDRLRFRPDCARCQHRFYGRHPDGRLLSRRQQVAAATGLVAASSLLHAGSALASDDQSPEVPPPSSPPAVIVDGGGGSGEGDGGGQSTPPPSSDDDGGGGNVGGGTGQGYGGGGAAPAPPGREVPQPRPQVHVPAPEAPQRRRPSAPRTAPVLGRENRDGQGDRRANPVRSEQGAASVEDAGETPSARAQERSSAGERSSAAQGADRTASERTGAESAASVHVVAEGECLWSIAERRLGPEATNTELASYVDELWRLNADRIATGNPDLIFSGQRLRTPSA